MGMGQAPPTNLHVLVVEDDPDVLEVTAGALAYAGYQVTTAAGTLEGLAALNQHLPDLVLTDLMMPDGSGHEIIRGARALPERPPVIVMTGMGISARDDALAAGARELLPKPFSMAQLLETIASAVTL